MTAKRSIIEAFTYFCLLLSLLIVLNKINHAPVEKESSSSMRGVEDRVLLNRESDEPEFVDEEEYIEYLSKKLSPQHLNTYVTDEENGKTALQQHQFLHLHHMKTGGTSMDGLLHCATNRLKKKEKDNEIAYMNIHECGIGRYRKCRDDAVSVCRDRINASAVLSYCAPLMDLETFGWRRDSSSDEEEVSTDFSLPNSKPHAVTVLRHPVNRVWSMFRFQTKGCYSCTPLLDVYKAIDANETSDMRETCITQLLNHQTRNLVSSQDFENMPEHEMLEDAIYNMKHFFTMIGLTEEMNETATMVGKVFPWMAVTIPNSTLECPMPHSNASPQNNRCGPNNTHWDLPPHPDNETAAAIIEHNALDMKLYEQAVQQFHYQKIALDMEQAITG